MEDVLGIIQFGKGCRDRSRSRGVTLFKEEVSWKYVAGSVRRKTEMCNVEDEAEGLIWDPPQQPNAVKHVQVYCFWNAKTNSAGNLKWGSLLLSNVAAERGGCTKLISTEWGRDSKQSQTDTETHEQEDFECSCVSVFEPFVSCSCVSESGFVCVYQLAAVLVYLPINHPAREICWNCVRSTLMPMLNCMQHVVAQRNCTTLSSRINPGFFNGRGLNDCDKTLDDW